MTKNTVFHRSVQAVKLSWLKPTLPANILAIYNLPIIKIFRFLGGFSTLYLVSNVSSLFLNVYIYTIGVYINVIISLLFVLFLVYINCHRILYMYKTLKNNGIEIEYYSKNSFFKINTREWEKIKVLKYRNSEVFNHGYFNGNYRDTRSSKN